MIAICYNITSTHDLSKTIALKPCRFEKKKKKKKKKDGFSHSMTCLTLVEQIPKRFTESVSFLCLTSNK